MKKIVDYRAAEKARVKLWALRIQEFKAASGGRAGGQRDPIDEDSCGTREMLLMPPANDR